MRPAPLGLIAALGAGLLLLRWRAQSASIDDSTGLVEADMGVIDTSAYDRDTPDFVDYDNTDVDGFPIANDEAFVADPDSNLRAFLYMIRASEHRFPADVVNDACYSIFYGGARFTDMSNHPVLTGEMRGVPLSAEMCRNAGFADGICVSTAAGAYQINVPTWKEIRSYDGPMLPDFSMESQDEAARRILKKTGALDFINEGVITRAVNLASRRWASLPGATSKQSPKTVQFAMARFNEGLTVA